MTEYWEEKTYLFFTMPEDLLKTYATSTTKIRISKNTMINIED